ncbi:MAG: transcription termination/antitermination protein NusA [Candidatus Dojkabacteria bacterium]|nr:MAG: transcription termination/antitermination protein NusA [Candidatus Dojkabacteria bacterium]GIW58747.1 MAG: transcription termination/antitermination protein NusA [Candidatus Dojkabacteria bacterium]
MSDQIDIMSAIRQIAAERKIDPDKIIEAIKQAIKTGFRNEYGVENLDLLTVDFEPEKGFIAVYITKKVVNKVNNPQEEISLKEAKELEPNVKVGDELLIDITPEGDFGRIAAQTARQIILQQLREAEKSAAISEIKEKLGSIENVVVQRFTAKKEVICEVNRARAVMPPHEQVPTEFYKIGSRIKVLLKSIEEDERGEYVLISRADPEFLEELFRLEVPEIDSGSVEIVNIAREAGSRAKVAVKSNAPGVDPIGACVGQKGVRINAISNELKLGNFEEKLDIILWDENIEVFLSNAIRPAEAIEAKIIDEKKKQALIVVSDDQLSLAIGKDGQNVRLSSKLTGWDLDIVGESEYKKQKQGNKISKPSKDSSKENKSDLESLGLSSRIINALQKVGIENLEDLRSKIENNEKIEGIGEKSLEEIKKALV